MDPNPQDLPESLSFGLPKSIVLIGMMGAGKTTIGRRVAERLGVRFVDADKEIEKAAGQSISELFEEYGEAYFRDGERRVIARLLSGPPCVVAAGGGAYIEPVTRATIDARAITLWLRADVDVLWERVRRRSHRPLLRTGNPRATLKGLMAERYPVYAEADIVVDSEDLPKEDMADRVIEALRAYLEHNSGRGRARQ